MRLRGLAALTIGFAILAPAARAAEPLQWQKWSPDVFKQAQAEKRLVILDLEAVWCHWCHVMEKTTYSDPKVTGLLASNFVTVRVDQDANPDLSNRYGDWGWPATIIFAADGTELIKRRGYIEPENMTALLEAVIADPTPGPSVGEDIDVKPAASPLLTKAQRDDLMQRHQEAYDEKNGGWGDNLKFIDADGMDVLLAAAEKGDADAVKKARQTFDAALHLIDPVWGGIYQYSDAVDWSSPHYEKIMSYQTSGLRQFAAAYGIWKDPSYLKAANDIRRYLTTKLQSPDGAFYTSQDADVDEAMHGNAFYALSAADRAKLGREPRIDQNVYARENGWAISGLAALYAATGDAKALQAAERAATKIIELRQIDGGGFKHGDEDRNGPYLGDTLAMGQATLDLYAVTGARKWYDVASQAGDFIASHFKDEAGGFKTAVDGEAALGVFLKVSKPLDEQIQATRFANKLNRYTGVALYCELAEHGARYLAAPAILDMPRDLPGVLLADSEISRDPAHITIVGHKDDATAQALHAAARAYPALYKRIDWWDTREGPLKNPDVTYPELDTAAAFVCTNKICSLPSFSTDEFAATMARLLASGSRREVQQKP